MTTTQALRAFQSLVNLTTTDLSLEQLEELRVIGFALSEQLDQMNPSVSASFFLGFSRLLQGAKNYSSELTQQGRNDLLDLLTQLTSET